MEQTYSNLPVSTQTFIVRSDLSKIDLQKYFDGTFPSEYIQTIKYKNQIKGDTVTKKTPKTASIRNFLNCVTLTILLDKKINIKIFNNGTFQMTGCKNKNHVLSCMNIILKELQEESVTYHIISVMRNVDFDIGYKIDRTVLGTFVDNLTNFSVPPMTTGYMAVKIKIPVENINVVQIPKVKWPENEITDICFTEFFKNDQKKIGKQYFVSLSVFQNGKVLISGIDESVIYPCYKWFKDFLQNANVNIKLKEKQKKTFIRKLQKELIQQA